MNVRLIRLFFIGSTIVIAGLISLFTVGRFGIGAFIGLLIGGLLDRMIPYHRLFG